MVRTTREEDPTGKRVLNRQTGVLRTTREEDHTGKRDLSIQTQLWYV